MEMPLSDVYDRLSILLLKYMHDPLPEITEELEYYLEEGFYLDIRFAKLLSINFEIWQLESEIRRGAQLDLGEVGRRAIAIRNWNRERVRIKNEISAEVGGFQERKIDHASEPRDNVCGKPENI